MSNLRIVTKMPNPLGEDTRTFLGTRKDNLNLYNKKKQRLN